MGAIRASIKKARAKISEGRYLIFILHHIHQALFIVAAGMNPVQVPGIKFLGTQFGIIGQIHAPFALLLLKLLCFSSVLG